MTQPATSRDNAQPKQVDRREVIDIIGRKADQRGGVIAVLQQIQSRYGYLPEEALRVVSERTGRSLVDIYGVATFYRAFSLTPRGKHLICACEGTACHVRGASRIVEELKNRLGIGPGETTPDELFTLETVNCLGACAMGPVMVIDGRYFSKVRTFDIRRLLEEAKAGFPQADDDRDGSFPIEAHCPLCNHDLTDHETLVENLPSIRLVLVCDGRVGPCNVSALLDSTEIAGDAGLPDDALLELFCPHCHGALAGERTCESCESPMAKLAVKGGGMVHICLNRRCGSRRLDLECVNG